VLNLPLGDRLENWREVNALQRTASIIMQPSIREGFGLTITEALWKSKPVIAANVGAIPLQIRDGSTGYFYHTVDETAKIVLDLLRNPDMANELGQRAKEYVREHFLLPLRMTDWLRAVNMVMNDSVNKETFGESIICFHPWFKLSKR
jgi:trehalose synthase